MGADWCFLRLLLPAPAGVILLLSSTNLVYIPFTRTCGGDPSGSVGNFVADGFYPHLRG